ncbi:hypothetical protein [Sphaerisporangium fuscum]|uniref:hypothetical protein n=1 Tax=Sphaerisporangium fuscum TaxID=2835868 RepID=UPI001BDC60CC|nr:hypothetical protein [Sphaerisporangium fuscum]
MRRHLSALAALTLAGSLAGASLALPAGAATATAPASSAHVTSGSQSPLSTKHHNDEWTYRGGAIRYTFTSKNVGEYPTDLAGIIMELPAGISKARITKKAADTLCDIAGRSLICYYETIKAKQSTQLDLKVWLKKSTKGTAVLRYQTFSIDVPAGVDVTNEEELNKLDIAGQADRVVTVKTKIVKR